MKKALLVMICIVINFTGAYAESNSSYNNESEYGDVKYYDFDLSAEVDGDIIKLEWDDFPSQRGFQYYKVMYSTSVSNPVYPDQNAAYVGSKRTDTSHKIALKNEQYHYFRICSITLNDDYSKDRYCGDTKKIVVEQEEEVSEETKKEYVERYKDIEYYDFDFQVDVTSAGKATARWNSYLQNRGFMYYKLMYSTKYANPSYPELSAKYVSDDISDSSNSFYISSGESHYFRICAITDEGYGVTGRYCSKTRKYTISDYEEEEYSDEDKQVADTNISDDLKKVVDERLEVFITGLGDRGYSDDEILIVINSVIGKLEGYKNIEKYKAIVAYMQQVLEEYKAEYSNALDIFDEIFGEY